LIVSEQIKWWWWWWWWNYSLIHSLTITRAARSDCWFHCIWELYAPLTS